jgi:type VI protein secretion system component Hcp
MNVRKKLTLTVAGALAALAVGSVAFGAIPDSGGVINACYEKGSGKLRVTDTETTKPKACTSDEAPLNWNQRGPQGPQGEPGPQGVPGPVGPQGPSGAPPALHTEVVGRLTLPGVNAGDPMPIRGFSWGAANSGGGFGGGAGGKATMDDVTLVRNVDAASPALISSIETGIHRPSASVDLFSPGTQTPYAHYALSDVQVTKLDHDGAEETFVLHAVDIDEQAVAGAPVPVLPADQQIGTLTLNGIPGELAISGAGFEIEKPALGAATIKPLRVDLAHGAAAPALLFDVLTGIHRTTATVQTANATYSLTDVVVRSVEETSTGAAGSIPSEQITLDAAQVQVTAP